MDLTTIIWLVLAFVGIIFLIYSFTTSSQGSIIAFLFLGLAVASAIALSDYYYHRPIDWYILPKGAVIGCLCGIVISMFKRQ